VLRFDADDDALLAGAPGVNVVVAAVFAAELADVLEGAFGGDFGDDASDLDEAVDVVGVDDRQGDAAVGG
jgi:hypothetical protein